ncbi:hypothetical protein KIW84_045412 [Lathyrus oleraceus]|uniref:SNF2 N-terminal domain-containing protein n=1 Tax=Pisum sativum TaxID=3888 RepID=A0A9D4XJ11_PEA|nr:hypothetical protein KIW84_045412 [Pisum sativum]
MAGGTKPKPRDEQYILRVAFQDLSQPKSEVSPPDGLLAVPLLRSWENSVNYFFNTKGKASIAQDMQKCTKSALETLDLDDDPLSENGVVKKESNVCQDTCKRNAITGVNLSVHTKGRPSAGTLVVCPTSVLRHRTKDPYELAKYDVVLTTYSIVSMEVHKQPLVDKDDIEKETYEDHAMPSKKRKCPSSSKSGKKKALDNMMLEDVACRLAKVAWFRVVLDEAQSIKNHRTQVARACWGLRAKRR